MEEKRFFERKQCVDSVKDGQREQDIDGEDGEDGRYPVWQCACAPRGGLPSQPDSGCMRNQAQKEVTQEVGQSTLRPRVLSERKERTHVLSKREAAPMSSSRSGTHVINPERARQRESKDLAAGRSQLRDLSTCSTWALSARQAAMCARSFDLRTGAELLPCSRV